MNPNFQNFEYNLIYNSSENCKKSLKNNILYDISQFGKKEYIIIEEIGRILCKYGSNDILYLL